MSIQEPSIQCDIPEHKSSSSMVMKSGQQIYDPSDPTEDDDVKNPENEQLNDSKHQTQEFIRINNGLVIEKKKNQEKIMKIFNLVFRKSARPVINTKDKAQSFELNEQQQSSRHRTSPDYHSKTSDRRSR